MQTFWQCSKSYTHRLTPASVYKISSFHKNVKLSLCVINEALRHEDVFWSGDSAPPLLTAALDVGGGVSGQLHPLAALTPGKEAPAPSG